MCAVTLFPDHYFIPDVYLQQKFNCRCTGASRGEKQELVGCGRACLATAGTVLGLTAALHMSHTYSRATEVTYRADFVWIESTQTKLFG